MIKMDANREESKAEMKADRKEMLAKTDAHHVWTEANQANREAMKVCLGTTEATDMEANPEEKEHREVPMEDAAVKSSGALKQRHRSQHLAARRRGKPQERTQGKDGFRKKLAAARRGTRREGVTQRKGNAVRKNRTRCNVEQGSRKEWTFGKRHRTKPKGSHGVKNRDAKEQLRLRSERTSGGIFGKTFGLEVAKRAARSSVMMRKITDWTLWRGRPPPKRKKSLFTALA
jgi:hypothetical protein